MTSLSASCMLMTLESASLEKISATSLYEKVILGSEVKFGYGGDSTTCICWHAYLLLEGLDSSPIENHVSMVLSMWWTNISSLSSFLALYSSVLEAYALFQS